MHQGVTHLLAMGAEVFRPAFLLLLADGYGKAGRVDAALQHLAAAREAGIACEIRSSEAEMARLEGGVLMQRPIADVTQAEACWQQAITVAWRQQARSLELRAALRLSRLWQQQGRRDAARTLLTEVYGWSTEGFETADLQQARALLEALGTA